MSLLRVGASGRTQGRGASGGNREPICIVPQRLCTWLCTGHTLKALCVVYVKPERSGDPGARTKRPSQEAVVKSELDARTCPNPCEGMAMVFESPSVTVS